jgi:hypothetical protein
LGSIKYDGSPFILALPQPYGRKCDFMFATIHRIPTNSPENERAKVTPRLHS